MALFRSSIFSTFCVVHKAWFRRGTVDGGGCKIGTGTVDADGGHITELLLFSVINDDNVRFGGWLGTGVDGNTGATELSCNKKITSSK